VAGEVGSDEGVPDCFTRRFFVRLGGADAGGTIALEEGGESFTKFFVIFIFFAGPCCFSEGCDSRVGLVLEFLVARDVFGGDSGLGGCAGGGLVDLVDRIESADGTEVYRLLEFCFLGTPIDGEVCCGEVF